MSAESETGEWYFSDLNTGGDFLAAVVASTCLVLKEIGFPEFSSVKSKKTYSDHWKIGMLVLKEMLDISYRDICDFLPSFGGVLAVCGINRIPDDSTLRKFANRLDVRVLDMAIAETARKICGPGTVVAVDATGFSESNASRHYVMVLKRNCVESRPVKDFAKASLAVDVETKAVVACDVATSRSGDVSRFLPLLNMVKDSGVDVMAVLADKGYDAEYAHEGVKTILGRDVETAIPVRAFEPKSARSSSIARPNGRYRKLMYTSLNRAMYRFRVIVETVNSMLKRKMGDIVYGKSLDSMAKEIKLAIVAHNLRLLFSSRLVIF